jgi:murein DD-endopeptidase MepM/ murein hydrolase activator NlpD
MKQKITVMLIPEKGIKPLSFTFSYPNLKLSLSLMGVVSALAGYICFDYLNLTMQRSYFYQNEKEVRALRSEAQALSKNLETLKKSLYHIDDFAKKIGDIVNLKVNTIKNKTGLPPLSFEKIGHHNDEMLKTHEDTETFQPLGLNLDKLILKPIFTMVSEMEKESNLQAHELQKLLSSLKHKKSLLYSIPTNLPARGWVSSAFGKRTSPHTGQPTEHRGIDIAAAIGTPIYAPADGFVIFSGTKPDFGNLVMLSHHGNSIVSKFAHNAENLVTTGQRISRGDPIATIGMTGNATGPHVHYEVWVHGQAENPMNFILDAENELF